MLSHRVEKDEALSVCCWMGGCPVKQIPIQQLCIKLFYVEPCSLALSPPVFTSREREREREAVERCT